MHARKCRMLYGTAGAAPSRNARTRCTCCCVALFFAGERAQLVAAVRAAMPRHVLEWVGAMGAHPDRWLSLLLDGELDGVPYAEVYGRSVKAIRAFRGFWRDDLYRRQCYRVIAARADLRRAVRPILVDIQKQLAEAAGYRVGLLLMSGRRDDAGNPVVPMEHTRAHYGHEGADTPSLDAFCIYT